MLRLSKTPVRTVTLPDASDSDADTVYQDRDGVFMDCRREPVSLSERRFQNGEATPYRFPGLSGACEFGLISLRDREGTLWIGTEGRGVYRQIGGRFVHYTTEQGLVNNFIRAFLQSRDGSVWIATDEGVSRWQKQKFTNYGMRDGLCYFSTYARCSKIVTGIFWIGTDRGISRLHGDKFENDATR